jgi:hypothetical protein
MLQMCRTTPAKDPSFIGVSSLHHTKSRHRTTKLCVGVFSANRFRSPNWRNHAQTCAISLSLLQYGASVPWKTHVVRMVNTAGGVMDYEKARARGRKLGNNHLSWNYSRTSAAVLTDLIQQYAIPVPVRVIASAQTPSCTTSSNFYHQQRIPLSSRIFL